MDDPWAAPSWSTPAQPSSSKPLSFSPPRSPPKDLGADDPWGAPVSAAPMAFAASPDAARRDDRMPSWGVNGGNGDGWGSEVDLHMPARIPMDAPEPERVSSPDRPSWESARLESPVHTERSPDTTVAEVDRDNEVTLDSRPTSPTPRMEPPRFPSPPPLDLPISRTDTPVVPVVIDEEDPEAAFAAALPRAAIDDMPKFDIAGAKQDDGDAGRFGGFSEQAFGAGDVAWSGKAESLPLDSAASGWTVDGPDVGVTSPRLDRRDGGEEEDGWGSAKAAAEVVQPAAVRSEMDWEATQRRLQLQDKLMPLEEMNALKKQWTDATSAVFSRAISDKIAIVGEDRFDGPEKGRETLRSLATIPSDINTYPPVLSSFQTYTTYQTTVGRPNPTPSTSILLSTTSAARRARRDTSGTSTTQTAPWLSRSRLGEPEAPAMVPSNDTAADASKSKWSFWGKKPEPKPLVTSGGGILEVKTPTSATTPAMVPQRPGMSSRQASISMSNPNTSARPSRTNSPAPTSLFDEVDDMPAQLGSPGTVLTSPVATTPAPPVSAQPSAMSRFFGRLGRRSSTQPTEPADPHDTKDLELGADDFSFLQEVPSLAPVDKTQGDLLGIESGRTESIASLESMISSKPVALPKPLAPPPPGPSLASPITRTGSSNSFRPPPKPQRQASNMDLLSGVFGDATIADSPKTSTTIASSGAGQNGVIGWDDFMGPSAAIQPISPPAQQRSSTSFPAFASPPPPAVPTKSPPRAAPVSSSFGDFDDFATPQAASSSKLGAGGDDFDDFGDFTDFAQAPAAPLAAPAPPPPNPLAAPTPARAIAQDRVPFAFQTTAAGHAPRASLDHTPTLNLLDSVNAVKGKRWPAPPSPGIPILTPPPGRSPAPAPIMSGSRSASGAAGGLPSGSGAFPFLSPPPPGRPSSGSGRTSSMDLFADEDAGMAKPKEKAGEARAFTPPIQPAAAPVANSSAAASQGGLTAQDLSFFDTL